MQRCYIGLGSNIGDRLGFLRQALAYIASHHGIQLGSVSPYYETAALLPENAPPEWNIPYINQVAALDTSLAPEALLAVLKSAEMHLGRQVRGHWGPREIDCDLLTYGSLSLHSDILVLPHPRMCERAFVLQPMHDIAPDVIVSGKTISEWLALCSTEDCLRYLPPAPALMGVLNVTPDSFSDGGQYFSPQSALAQCRALIEQGAGIIDVGAESTRPGATPLNAEDEWQRLEPVLSTLRTTISASGATLSLDSYHPQTVARALDYGVGWVNDVSGFSNTAMLEAVVHSQAQLVAMHSLGIPANPSHTLPEGADVISVLCLWAEKLLSHLINNGVPLARVVLDPGVGFGKTPQQSLTLVLEASKLLSAFPDVRWLYGHSRKSYQKLVIGDEMSLRDAVTLSHSLHLAQAGVHYLRVHNVAGHAAMFRQSGCYAFSR